MKIKKDLRIILLQKLIRNVASQLVKKMIHKRKKHQFTKD